MEKKVVGTLMLLAQLKLTFNPMPPQNTHEIFRKELELFDTFLINGDFTTCEFISNDPTAKQVCNLDEKKIRIFLLQSLKRASLSVVEESLGKNKEWYHYDKQNEAERLFDGFLVDNEEEGRSIPYRYLNASKVVSQNELRESTLATARTIVGEEK